MRKNVEMYDRDWEIVHTWRWHEVCQYDACQCSPAGGTRHHWLWSCWAPVATMWAPVKTPPGTPRDLSLPASPQGIPQTPEIWTSLVTTQHTWSTPPHAPLGLNKSWWIAELLTLCNVTWVSQLPASQKGIKNHLCRSSSTKSLMTGDPTNTNRPTVGTQLAAGDCDPHPEIGS